ncbi:MAG: segregation and condensation protein A [Oceanobacter sp.]
MKEIMLAYARVLRRGEHYESHEVQREQLSTRERMSQILDQLKADTFVPFESLFSPEEGRLGVVVSFLAMLELVKESLVELVQQTGFGPIHVRLKAASNPEESEELETLSDTPDERNSNGEQAE